MHCARVMVLAAAIAATGPGVASAGGVEPPDDFGVVCVDARTGAERWRTPVAAGWPPRLRLADGALWVGRADGAGWTRRDLATGAARGVGAPPAEPAREVPPGVVDVRAFWTSTDAILHDHDGQPRTVVTTGAFVDDLAIAGDTLVFTLDADDGQVYGFGLGQGRLRWVLRPRQRVPGFEAGDGSRVEVLGGRLLVHAPPALLAVEPTTGAIAWTAQVPALAGRWGPLRAIELGATWVVAVDGVVVALDAATGRVRWTLDAGDGGATAPVAGEGLVCLDRRDAPPVPFTRDEAEVARALAIELDADGAPLDVRWVARADVPAGARRVPLLELPEAGADAAARLELTALDAAWTADAARLAGEGVVYVEVPGRWEQARWIGPGGELATR